MRKAIVYCHDTEAGFLELSIPGFYQYASRRSKQKDSLQKLAIG